MVYVLSCVKKEREAAQIDAAARDAVARVSDDYWEMKQLRTGEELRAYLDGKPLIHLIIYDVCGDGSLELLLELRKSYPQPRLLVVADVSISPMAYIRPELQVSALLLKPWTKQQLNDVLFDFVSEYAAYAESSRESGSGLYVVETRDGTISIPYDQIYFFEAREKKIYVCAGREAFGFYSTIDRLMEELPDGFVRCHRGFIVNTKKIRKVVLSQNIIYLSDGFDVPLSRSYKAALKGMGRT